MEEFEEYYENKHVPLVLEIAPFITRYTRNYVTPDSTFNKLDSLQDSPCDVITEAWFDSDEDVQHFITKAAEPEVRKKVVADELNFLERESMKMFLVKECGGIVTVNR